MRVKLDMPLHLYEIADSVKGKCNTKDFVIHAICTDTREVTAKDLFVALDGENISGENFIPEAISKGAYTLARSDISSISVDDTSNALLNLAAYYKTKLNIKHTIAVTGSVGKSTTVKFITKILSRKYKVHFPHGNFNNHIGVPLTVLSTPKETELLVTELGMNHKNEISKLSKCVKPDIGMITNIGTAHIGNLGTRNDIASAKLEILAGIVGGSLLLPKKEPLLSNIKNSFYVARNSSLSDFSLNNESVGYSFDHPEGRISGIHFFDDQEHLLSDLSFSLSAAILLGMSDCEILEGAKTINRGDLRQRFIALKDFTIFDDSYNASIESVISDLAFLSRQSTPTGAFLGDILELGEATKEIHESIGFSAAKMNIGNLYLYGNNARYIEKGALEGGMNPDNIFVNDEIATPERSVDQIIQKHIPGEIILFKASHKLRLDKIADYIKEKEGLQHER